MTALVGYDVGPYATEMPITRGTAPGSILAELEYMGLVEDI